MFRVSFHATMTLYLPQDSAYLATPARCRLPCLSYPDPSGLALPLFKNSGWIRRGCSKTRDHLLPSASDQLFLLTSRHQPIYASMYANDSEP